MPIKCPKALRNMGTDFASVMERYISRRYLSEDGAPSLTIHHDEWCDIYRMPWCHCHPEITLKSTTPHGQDAVEERMTLREFYRRISLRVPNEKENDRVPSQDQQSQLHAYFGGISCQISPRQGGYPPRSHLP